jgi:hypothetical protein
MELVIFIAKIFINASSGAYPPVDISLYLSGAEEGRDPVLGMLNTTRYLFLLRKGLPQRAATVYAEIVPI